MHKYPKLFTYAEGIGLEACVYVPSSIYISPVYPVMNASCLSLNIYAVIIIHLIYIYVAMEKLLEIWDCLGGTD